MVDSSRCKLLRSLNMDSEKEVETEVSGEMPEWLVGTLIRNGPGKFEFGDKAVNHLLDGLACVHKFKITKGKVVFSNKFIETQSFVQSLTNKNK